jgi:hypothetical protein
MSNPLPRYSKEEHARRGTTLYEQQVRPQVEANNRGKIVAIDVDTTGRSPQLPRRQPTLGLSMFPNYIRDGLQSL